MGIVCVQGKLTPLQPDVMTMEELDAAIAFHQDQLDALTQERDQRLTRERQAREQAEQASFYIRRVVLPLVNGLSDEQREEYAEKLIAARFTKECVRGEPSSRLAQAVALTIGDPIDATRIADVLCASSDEE